MNKSIIVMGLLASLTLLSSCNTNTNGNEQNKAKSSLTVQKSNFQSQINDKETALFVLENEQGMKVAITNYGGRIVSWLAPDKEGNFDDIVFGFDSIKGYLNANEVYFGALIGRYGNRIEDGTFSLNGSEYSLAKNNGANSLHGGPGGFHNVVWDAKQLDDQHLRLEYHSKDGEEGFPGNLKVQVLYILNDQNELTIDYTAVTDEATPVNLTNHAFFNLGGASSGKITDHELMVNAEKYTPVDSTLIPTGKIKNVEGTPFDFTTATTVGERVNNANKQLTFGKGYDHNFVLKKEDKATLSLAAQITEPNSGRTMEIFTTEPGIQFYSGNFLDGSDTGKGDISYEFRTSFALEPQHFPNSPNESGFPSTILQPDEIYHTMSIYKLSIDDSRQNQ